MKTINIAAAALAALLVSTAASAQSVSGTVTIDGTVQAKCVIAPAATITLGEMAGVTGVYNNVADGKTATLTAWCNGAASTMTVASTAISLVGGGAVPTGFTNTVNFTGTASVTPAGAGGAVSASDSTTAAPSAAAAVSLFSNDITVALSASSTNGGKLIAGTYQGSVVVTLAPLA